MEEEVNERVRDNMLRIEALQNAVRHRLREETPEQVVRAAEKYFAFLQGKAE